MTLENRNSETAAGKVAIIGGGLSGLATAVQLQLAGQDRQPHDEVEITLFEASDRTGGVIHTESIDGFVIDHGADMFATKPTAAIDLIRRLGAECKLIEPEPTRRGARIVSNGKLVPIPDGFVLMRATRLTPMLTTPLLSVRGKLRFLAERFVAASPLNREENQEYDESVESFVRRRMGDEVLQNIVAPLSAGIYTADISKLSMRSTMGPIYAMERKHGSLAKATSMRKKSGEDSVERASTGARYGQFRAFRGGSIELIQTLADALPPGTIRLNTPVKAIKPTPDSEPTDSGSTRRWQIETVDGTLNHFDHVIVSLPPRAAERLLNDLVPDAAEQLRQIEAASAAIAVLCVRREDVAEDIDTFGFVVPATEQRQILAGSFASHKFAGRASQDNVIVRVFMGGAMQPELLEKSDEELIQIARDELGDIIGLSGDPLLSKVVRWKDAMPQYHVGHHLKVQRIESAMDAVAGLTLMNNALHGVGIAPVIAHAAKVAQLVLDEFNSAGGTNKD